MIERSIIECHGHCGASWENGPREAQRLVGAMENVILTIFPFCLGREPCETMLPTKFRVAPSRICKQLGQTA